MRLLQPLRHRSVALLWSGLALSAIGDQLYAVALSWIAVGVLGAGAGYLTALQSGCILFSVLSAGFWLDRWDSRRVLVADYLVEATALALVVMAWTQTGSASPTLLVLAVIVLSIGIGITRPAVQAILPELLPDHAQLPAANALIDSTERIARLAGPLIVGALAGLLPEQHFLTLDALSFVAAAGAAMLLPPAVVRPIAPRARARDIVLRGITALRADTLLRDCWRVTSIANGTWMVTFFLCVPLAIQRAGVTGPGGSGLGAFGLVIACYGMTNFAALLVVGNRKPSPQPAGQIIAARAVMTAGMAIVTLTAWIAPPDLMLPGFMLGALVAAPSGPMGDVPIAVMRQTRVGPDEIVSVVRAFIANNQVGSIVGLLVAPALIHALGIAGVVGLCSLLTAGVGVFMLLRSRRYAIA
jgi:MFS family permease